MAGIEEQVDNLINELERQKKDIDNMSQESMCCLVRFAPPGHPYFVMGTAVSEYFDEVFKEKGGFTSAISKSIGWDR